MSDKAKFSDRLSHAWNAFKNQEKSNFEYDYDIGPISNYRPDRTRLRSSNEKSIISAIYTRIAIDVSEIQIQHIKQNENGRFEKKINSGLNYCLNIEANIDQANKAFVQDVVISMFDEGHVCIVPVDTTLNPEETGSYDVQTLRTGKVIDWYPETVRVELYNDKTGLRQKILLPKKNVAIVENPLYSIMNEPNSTLKRLIRKLNLLDGIDEQSSSGKLDIIIQLPYSVKSESRKIQAEQRRKEIERQLQGSKYGIAYMDGTEKITQLNRASENNLMAQIEYLTTMLYNQLGITEEVFKGTANEETMLNYNNRTVAPIVSAIVDEMKRKFLTKTARTQGQTLMAFRDAFKLVPVSSLAEISDKFTRNEILTSNEVRAIIGYTPSEDPNADELRNKNLNQAEGAAQESSPAPEQMFGQDQEEPVKMGEESNELMDIFNALLDQLELDIDDVVEEVSA